MSQKITSTALAVPAAPETRVGPARLSALMNINSWLTLKSFSSGRLQKNWNPVLMSIQASPPNRFKMGGTRTLQGLDKAEAPSRKAMPFITDKREGVSILINTRIQDRHDRKRHVYPVFLN